jgi:molecular chaperone GrpE
VTEHDRDAPEEREQKVRVVDKRRYREGEDAGEAAPPPRPAGSPTTGRPTQTVETDDLAKARTEAAEYRDHLQRLQAEFENYRKRMTRSQERLVDAELQRFVQRLLEVLDEFDLALIAAERQPDFDAFRKGVELVYAKLAETLRAEGLERIEAEGTAFDPNEHEALMQTGEGEGDPHVAEVFRQGYRLRGAVIRPASVRVERG